VETTRICLEFDFSKRDLDIFVSKFFGLNVLNKNYCNFDIVEELVK
jgi:hypothetical protein